MQQQFTDRCKTIQSHCSVCIVGTVESIIADQCACSVLVTGNSTLELTG